MLLRYDWSGKYLIGTSKLQLEVGVKDSLLSGIWQEEGVGALNIRAVLADSGLVFQNTAYHKKSHYNIGNKEELQFVRAQLDIASIEKSILLSGRLQYYLPDKMEPEKPVYISLVRMQKAEVNNEVASKSGSEPNGIQMQRLSLPGPQILKVYPNPFEDKLYVSLSLEKEQKVKFSLFDIQGKLFYTREATYGLGNQTAILLLPHLAAGSYVLQLRHGGKTESRILVRQ